MEDDVELGIFTVRGQHLTTVSIGESKWCCFVEICSKLLPGVNRANIHNRVNRSKARMVLADKVVVAALKRQEVITKHTGKVYLISIENISLVLSLFDENAPGDPSQDSNLEDEDGGNPGEEGVDKMVDDEECETEIGAEEVITESGLPESLNDGDPDGDGDENSDEDDNMDEKIVDSVVQVSASNVPVPGPGRGRRRCPNCSTILKSKQPNCTHCGKRLSTPGRKRRSGFPGAYGRRMKRKRLEAKEQQMEQQMVEVEYDDDKQTIPTERPRRWRRWCTNCQAACTSTAVTCPRCGNTNLRETGQDAPMAMGTADDDNDGDDVDDMNDGGEEAMEAGHGDDAEQDDCPKPKGARSKWCRHCALYMPENCTECTACGRPVKRKYRRRCANISSRPATSKRRAALVARATTVSGQPRHRTDVDDHLGNGDNSEQGMGSGPTGGKWCSRCQKTAPPLVTHCLICGKELKRVYRKRSAIWQQNQQNQVQQQQERLQERRRAGIKGLAGVAGGYEVTGSDGQHLNWSQRYNLTSFIPDEEHVSTAGDGARPTMMPDSVEVRGGRAVLRRAELKRHESYMPRNANEAVGIVGEQPMLRRPIVDLPPRPTQATEREKLHYAQCFLNIKMGVSQSDLIGVITEARHRHQSSIDSSARSFEDVDAEYQATKERTTHLECESKSLEMRLASLKQQLSAGRKEVRRIGRLARQTEQQANLYTRVAHRFHKRLFACTELLEDNTVATSSSSASAAASASTIVRTPVYSTAGAQFQTRLQHGVDVQHHSTIAASTASLPGSTLHHQHPAATAGTVMASSSSLVPPPPSAEDPLHSSSIATLSAGNGAPAVAAETWAQLQAQQMQVSHEHGRDLLQAPSTAMVS
eukprot:scpid44302/ scgid5297/ 